MTLPPAYPAPISAESSDAQSLRRILARVRRRDRAAHVLTALGMALCVLAAGIATSTAADYLFRLPWPARAAWMATILTSAALAAWRRGLQHAFRPIDDDTAALQIERATPELRQRLISAVQLSRPGHAHSQQMVRELLRDTSAALRHVLPSRIVPLAPAWRWAATGLVAASLLGGWAATGGDLARSLLARTLCLPGIQIPRQTQVHLSPPAHRTIARGDTVELRASVTGTIPRRGQLTLDWSDGMTESLDAAPAAESDFAATVPTAWASFRYRFTLGDGQSEWGTVRVMPPPVAEAVTLSVTPPSYTGLPERPVTARDIEVLTGSSLSLSVRASRALSPSHDPASTNPTSTPATSPTPPHIATTRLRFRAATGSTVDVPLVRSATDPSTAATPSLIAIPTDATGLSIILVDEHGLESRDPPVYRIEHVPDRPPSVRILSPDRRETLRTPLGRVEIAFELTDDVAVTELFLHARVLPAATTSPGPTTARIALDIPVAPPGQSVRGRYLLELTQLSRRLRPESDAKSPRSVAPPTLPTGTQLEWWLEARDANPAPGPGVALTDRQLIRIASAAEVRAELMRGLGQTLGHLETVRRNQQELSRDLGTLVREKPEPQPPK